VLDRLASENGVVHILVGSNDGTTQRIDLEHLLDLAGPPRANLRIGLVAFENAYFHPKTLHCGRFDGTELAYVGSANLTPSGVASLHVEAGVVFDTLDGDDPDAVAHIRKAIDWWFESTPAGFTLISNASDLDDLETQGVIGVPRAAPVRRPSPKPSGSTLRTRLTPLLAIPPLLPLTPVAINESHVHIGNMPSPAPTTIRWSKKLTRSDAQRKPTGNQRGGITLVAAGYPINAQTYFRLEFFADVDWLAEKTLTGQERQRAVVQFSTAILGTDVGTIDISITYAPNREASQANYTTMLHLGPLATYFASDDMTNRVLLLERLADGSYTLTIS
jgi:hypothetical protein